MNILVWMKGFMISNSDKEKNLVSFGLMNDVNICSEVEWIKGEILQIDVNGYGKFRSNDRAWNIPPQLMKNYDLKRGIIICIFLVLVMYYKQISEGYEDQDLYQILSKVGLSEEDSKSTIRQQIKLVFMIPAAIAILNTLAGMKLFVNMMYALNLFNTKVMIGAFLIVILCFIVFYIVSYMQTARSYYKIVSK